MIDNAGGPSNIRPNDPNNHYPGLTNFSLLTHGFGNPVINSSLAVLQTYLQDLLAYYEGRQPINVPERRYSAYGGEKSSNRMGGVSGTGMESVSMQQGGGHISTNSGGVPSNGIHQNPLLYATRHYPNGRGSEGGHVRQTESMETREGSSMENGDGDGEVMVEVTLKEEPVD